MDQTALGIYQEALDDLSRAIDAADTGAVMDLVRLPFMRRMHDTETLIETRDDMQGALDDFGRPLRAGGVNQIVRLAGEARFLSPVFIAGHHVTHLMRDGTPVFPSFSTRTVLMLENGAWKVAEIDSAMPGLPWQQPGTASQDTPPATTSDPELRADDVRCGAADPVALYQGFLDTWTQALMRDSLEGYCAHCMFPYTSHTNAGDHVIAQPIEARPYFDMLRNLIDENRVDRFERRATQAVFISADEICGYHTTRLLSRGQIAVGPVLSRAMLRRIGPDWRLTAITNSVANEDFPNEAPEPSDVLVTLTQIQERIRKND